MNKIRVFEAFSGIGAQHEGWKRLQKDFPMMCSLSLSA